MELADKLKADAVNNLIYMVTAGSHSYGLNVEGSDEDVRGVFVPPPTYLVGLYTARMRQQRSEPKDEDTHHFSIATFLYQAAKGAPNILELAFVEPQHVRMATSFWDMIHDNRNILLSRKIGTKGLGFMKGMLERSAKEQSITPDEMKRKELMHAVRMGRMVLETLKTGKLRVFRGEDRDDLLSIRYGERNRESVVNECHSLRDQIEVALQTTVLPDECDMEALDALAVHITLEYWRWKQWV